MRDVASRAQVSVRTVSRVINSQGEITEATRQRVLATIDEMDFRPSKLARGLGLAPHRHHRPHRRRYRQSLFLGNSPRHARYRARCRLRRFLLQFGRFMGRGVAGAAFPGRPRCGWDRDLSKSRADRRTHQTVCRSFLPDRDARLSARPSSHQLHLVEIRKGACHAVEYLIDKGHTTIAMLGGPAPTAMIHWRVKGYRDALLAHGLKFRAELVCSGVPVFERGHVSPARYSLAFLR